MTIWWCMAVVNHHRLFKNALKVVSFEFAGFALNSPIGEFNSPIGEFKGGLGNDVFGTQKREWTNSVIGLASRECIRNGWPSWNCRTSLPSQKYVIWIWIFFGKNLFFSKNSRFFWKICRWENQENHIKKCFCDEIKKGAASQTHLGHLASSGRFLRTRVAPKSQFAGFADFACWIRRIRRNRRIRRIGGGLRNCSEIASILTFRISKVRFAGIY